ncbi:hypothetical protein [Nocardia asiatica]|uniref:hypothetical protein n=1 Tax=Nocardia asiatica TaxID=209252 RepID=UPI003EDF1C34
MKAPAALVRVAAAQRGAALAIREGGEIASAAMARETAATFTREGGAILASEAQASTEMMQALQRGSMVVATEGGLNHAVIYTVNAEGQVIRLHGGPLRLFFREAAQPLSKQGARSMASRVNAYAVVEAAEATVPIEQAVERVSAGAPAALRWLGGNPTSCGIMQGALLEASGLSSETLAKLVPAGGAAERILPNTVLDHMAQSRFDAHRRGRYGTHPRRNAHARPVARRGRRRGSARLLRAAVGGEFRRSAFRGRRRCRTRDRSAGSPGRTQESDAAAIAIVNRFGRVLVGPVTTVRDALPDIVAGWYVREPAFHAAVGESLTYIGMARETAAAIVR